MPWTPWLREVHVLAGRILRGRRWATLVALEELVGRGQLLVRRLILFLLLRHLLLEHGRILALFLGLAPPSAVLILPVAVEGIVSVWLPLHPLDFVPSVGTDGRLNSRRQSRVAPADIRLLHRLVDMGEIRHLTLDWGPELLLEVVLHVASDRRGLLRHEFIEDLVADLLLSRLGELGRLAALVLPVLQLGIKLRLVLPLHAEFVLLLARLVTTDHLHAAAVQD